MNLHSKMSHILKNHLYKQGTKYTQIVNPYKFKINATGPLAINGNSTVTITNSSTAQELQ